MLTRYTQRFNNILCISLFILLLLIICVFSIQKIDEEKHLEKYTIGTNEATTVAEKKQKEIDKVRDCFVNTFNSMVNISTMNWFEIPRIVEECAKYIRTSIPFIEAGPENYERKYYMIPRLQYINEPCSVITFGIGGEIVSEQHIKMTLPHCTFIGFDPNPDYEKLFTDNLSGKFIQTAVGGKNGNMTIFRLQKGGYEKAPDTKIRAAAELIETYHGSNKIVDILNIDIEGSEYGIFEEIMNDKIFENVCQINVEIHPVWYHDTGYTYSNAIEILENLMKSGTFIWVKTDNSIFVDKILEHSYICPKDVLYFNTYNTSILELNNKNISETLFESCFNESTIIEHNNLNISKIPGFPFVSNFFQKHGYANIFRSLADWQFTTEIDNIRVEDVKCGDIIFVTQHFINYFFDVYHLSIKNKYILISHESDYPAGYPWHQMYLNIDTIVHWFAQNPVVKHPKIEPIPIGILPNNGNTFETLYSAVKNNIFPYFDRTTLLYLNFSPNTNRSRIDIIQYFKKHFKDNSFKIIIDEERISWKQYLSKMGNSQFVLSPPGNGIDCFRTWESLAMGAVPIVLKTELQPLYDDMPVMVVNDWKEVTEANMKHFQQTKLTKFDKDGIPLRPKLWVRYWINHISKFKYDYVKNFC